MRTSYQAVIKSDKSAEWPCTPLAPRVPIALYPISKNLLHSCPLAANLSLYCKLKALEESRVSLVPVIRVREIPICPPSNYPFLTKGQLQGEDYDMQACNKHGGDGANTPGIHMVTYGKLSTSLLQRRTGQGLKTYSCQFTDNVSPNSPVP